MSNCSSKISTAIGLMKSIEDSHDSEVRRAKRVVYDLLALCKDEIADYEDVPAIQAAFKFYEE